MKQQFQQFKEFIFHIYKRQNCLTEYTNKIVHNVHRLTRVTYHRTLNYISRLIIIYTLYEVMFVLYMSCITLYELMFVLYMSWITLYKVK